MGDDILSLIIAAAFGFVSALLLELVRGRIANKNREKERALESRDGVEKNRKEFLASTPDKKVAPAWLTLVKTNSGISFFQNEQTDDAVILELLENPAGNLPDGVAEPTVQKYLLSQTQIIGRDDDCEIRLTDSTVSRLHAVIRYEDGCFVLYDLGSKSGTYVNGKRLSKTGKTLEFGDRLVVGESVFLFYGFSNSSAPAAADPTPASTVTKPPRISKSRQK